MKKTIAIVFTGILLSIGFAKARPVSCYLAKSGINTLFYSNLVGVTNGTITSTNGFFFQTTSVSGFITVTPGTYTITSGSCVRSLTLN